MKDLIHNFPQPAWSAFREAKFGHGSLTVIDAVHMRWQWHRIVDDESTFANSVEFVKNSFPGSELPGVTVFGNGSSDTSVWQYDDTKRR